MLPRSSFIKIRKGHRLMSGAARLFCTLCSLEFCPSMRMWSAFSTKRYTFPSSFSNLLRMSLRERVISVPWQTS